MSTWKLNNYMKSFGTRGFVLVNPFMWLEMKIKYLNIINTLDPNFSEDEFKRGAKQVLWDYKIMGFRRRDIGIGGGELG